MLPPTYQVLKSSQPISVDFTRLCISVIFWSEPSWDWRALYEACGSHIALKANITRCQLW